MFPKLPLLSDQSDDNRTTHEPSHGYLSVEGRALLERSRGGVHPNLKTDTSYVGECRQLNDEDYLEVVSREYFSDELTEFLKLTRGKGWSDEQ
ncbi:hypothetical protein BCT46_15390 [Vibrio sp. 10N.261.46.E8]|nr:hypothetical protein BH584_05210 [Vibrio sp. 10N.261.45.E1]PMJ34472.1 hypothetical protein BCU27_03325 [Vibrio sp. 10N.286.45.B6]PML88000.1 hypothetical protein BCT66_10395 [Vibrio sp. 10N.261.49.E11]PMM67327.1 hypothetical protein BCT48_14865 [Vibrio sp. 10N.261.46.F12]PMM81789.1 hypothetical protein BCT46_15390 [Vibrio sp. 10N.261.46.E8]PMN77843.1 hypothetical protein BCT22_19935 [Vibrio sp. 10N.261.45.A1]PMN92017.1 hypothetical protein BCT25_01340 [Vibrio sp. 10N.261.45.A6]